MSKIAVSYVVGIFFIGSLAVNFWASSYSHEKPISTNQSWIKNTKYFLDRMNSHSPTSNKKTLIAQLDSKNPNEGYSNDKKEPSQEIEPSYEVPTFNLPSAYPENFGVEPPNEIESFPVIFKAFYRGILSSEVTSRVVKITRRMGERFKVTELLVQLDDTIFEGLRQKAIGLVKKAEVEFSSKQELYKQNISSIYEVKTAESNLSGAISELINADHAINACFIRAPFDGKVVNLMVEEHELIQQGKPLIEIVNDDYLIGQVLAPTKLLPILVVGKPVKIKIHETGTTEKGEILRLDAVIDPASSLIKVDILVNNFEQKLRSGMIGDVVFEDQESPGRAQ